MFHKDPKVVHVGVCRRVPTLRPTACMHSAIRTDRDGAGLVAARSWERAAAAGGVRCGVWECRGSHRRLRKRRSCTAAARVRQSQTQRMTTEDEGAAVNPAGVLVGATTRMTTVPVETKCTSRRGRRRAASLRSASVRTPRPPSPEAASSSHLTCTSLHVCVAQPPAGQRRLGPPG